MLTQLFRDKFDVLLIAVLFVMSFIVLVSNQVPELNSAIRDINQGLLYALLALLGVRARQAPSVGSATTETGDIITQPPPTESAKEPKKNEKDNS